MATLFLTLQYRIKYAENIVKNIVHGVVFMQTMLLQTSIGQYVS